MLDSVSSRKKKCRARLIAFYLPQYHPIPENDRWWGKGFTEWTNVRKAQSLFEGHNQPHIPTDFGYYDLRDPLIRKTQAELAKSHGIEGFCYWHYWFSGKQVIERPFQEVLKSGEPDFPFCLGWANDSWRGVWYGAPRKMLIEQKYPGVDDDIKHFYAIFEAFRDRRYLTIKGKPVFYIYKPRSIPRIESFIALWNSLARKEGFDGIYFIANAERRNVRFEERGGFSAISPSNPGWSFYHHFHHTKKPYNAINRAFLELTGRSLKDRISCLSRPCIYSYREYCAYAFPRLETSLRVFPCVVPNWDNTPRCGVNGVVLSGSTPELFRRHLVDAISLVQNYSDCDKIVFIKSWNEWAEGNYLEPDQRYGYDYLQACREEVYSV